jgi:hypothetical protein
MNRTLCWRAFARSVSAAILVASAGFGCGSEDEGSGISGVSTGGSSGVSGGSGGVGAAGASGTAGMMMSGGAGGVGGATGGIGGATGGVGGMTGGVGGMVAGDAGGMTGGDDPDGGTVDPDGGAAGMGGDGSCCDDGDCICREAPTALSSAEGPYPTDSYSLPGVGCIYYPTSGAEPPFAAVAISDGYLGTGGCGRTQTNGWGPLYASHGIVAMIVETGSGDQPRTRGNHLIEGIDGFKQENMNSSSPLNGKLAGRYGTSGFSMGGGGTTYASSEDSTLLSSVAMMPWGPTSDLTVPTLIICGASDRTAGCGSHGRPAYGGIADSVDKMLIVVSGGHVGQPTAGGGDSGAVGLAFTKLYLEGDQRWKPFLLMADYEETNIE